MPLASSSRAVGSKKNRDSALKMGKNASDPSEDRTKDPGQANVLYVSLNYMKPNLVQWNKDVIWAVNWMKDVQECPAMKIKTSTEHIGEEISMELDVKFSLYMEPNFTSRYLTSIINHPVIITAYDATNAKSATKGGTKSTGEVLGVACLDVLPLFWPNQPISAVKSSSPRPLSKPLSPVYPDIPEQERSLPKVPDREIRAELTLEPKDAHRGAELVTPMNKVRLGLSALLHLEYPIPESLSLVNILTIVIESAYNLPAPLSNPESNFTTLHYSLGLTLPLVEAESVTSLASNTNKSKSSSLTGRDEEHSREPVHLTLEYTGHASTAPDPVGQAKWRAVEDLIPGRARYAPIRLDGDFEDVKYGDTVAPQVRHRNHIQWNQMSRVWLTHAAEDAVREQIAAFGAWPIETLINARKKAGEDRKAGRSMANTGGGNLISAKKAVVDPGLLPMTFLALADLSDLIHPGLRRTRVLATFQPQPSLTTLKSRTGIDRFKFVDTKETSRPPTPANTPEDSSKKTSKLSVGKSQYVTPSEESSKDIGGSSQVDPFCIIMVVELSRALTEKPERETTLHELSRVIAMRHQYVPDLGQKQANQIQAEFERAVAKCTRIFYAEHEDFVKVKAAIRQHWVGTIRPTGQSGHETKDGHGEYGDQIMDGEYQMPSGHKSGEETKRPHYGNDTNTKRDHKSKSHSKNDNKTRSDFKSNQKSKLDSFVDQTKNDLKNKQKTSDFKSDQKMKLESKIGQTKIDLKTDPETVDHQKRTGQTRAPPKISLSNDFKQYLSRSGAITKCFDILERPMMAYVRFKYEPDNGPGAAGGYRGLGAPNSYGAAQLGEIHAHLMAVMSRIVQNVECDAGPMTGGGKRVRPADECTEFGGTRSALDEATSDMAVTHARLLSYADQYAQEGYQSDAQRLYLSRIRSAKAVNSNNAHVWSDYGRYCLGRSHLWTGQLGGQQREGQLDEDELNMGQGKETGQRNMSEGQLNMDQGKGTGLLNEDQGKAREGRTMYMNSRQLYMDQGKRKDQLNIDPSQRNHQGKPGQLNDGQGKQTDQQKMDQSQLNYQGKPAQLNDGQGKQTHQQKMDQSQLNYQEKPGQPNDGQGKQPGQEDTAEAQLLMAEECLKQSVNLSVKRDSLMMLAYVSYQLKQWDKAELYFTSLALLFESSMEVWMTVHVYYLSLGKAREAATALHMAQICAANRGREENGGQMSGEGSDELHRNSELSSKQKISGTKAAQPLSPQQQDQQQTKAAQPLSPQQNVRSREERHGAQQQPLDQQQIVHNYEEDHKTQQPLAQQHPLGQQQNSHNSEEKRGAQQQSLARQHLDQQAQSETQLPHPELWWTAVTPLCSQNAQSGNSVYLRVVPLLLNLNMLEFADTCIGEHLLRHKHSPQAAYYLAVSHYKRRQHLQTSSHLNTIPPPLNQCLPVLVLKFHNACALINAHETECTLLNAQETECALIDARGKSNCPNYGQNRVNAPEESNNAQDRSNNARDKSINAPHECATCSPHQCCQIYASMQWELEEGGEGLKYLVLLRLAKMGIDEEHKVSGKSTNGGNFSGKSTDGNKFSGPSTDGNKISGSSTNGATRGGATEEEGGDIDVEQILLGLASEYETPLIWYYLGMFYLKRSQFSQSELALNEANKLDPHFGNVWATLALVNYHMRRPALFRTCQLQARKYGANQELLEKVDKLALFISQ
ncbi:hypothetical protein M8J75_016534 [Diaphorina citri]|nr:hypothetical protein M8J75_016534 [Diaphorina citri]